MKLQYLVLFLTMFTLPLGCDSEGPGETQDDCESTHAYVGKRAPLAGYAHDISGYVTVVDDCTLELTEFTYDGAGLDVKLIAGEAGTSGDDQYVNGTVLSEDLRKSGGYENDTVSVPLPTGVSLDDFNNMSIWCVSVGENFADATFDDLE